MFHQTIIYLLVFNALVCFGYKKISQYSAFQEKTEGGAVFQLAPDGEVKIKGVVGEQNVIFDDLYIGLKSNDNLLHGSARMICVEFLTGSQPYNRLSLRIQDHGYYTSGARDEMELEEFVVNTCDKDHLNNIFVVLWIEANKYALTFKDTNSQCFIREIEVIEEELTLTVRRQEPVKQDCSALNDDLKSEHGYVVPQSWMDNGDLLDLTYNSLPKGSKFQMQGKIEDEPKKSTFTTRRLVNNEDQRFVVVNMFQKAIPIDRLIAKTHSEFLDFSFRRENFKKGKVNEVHINYLNTKGVCLRRKYEITVQLVDGDDHLRRVTVKRHTPQKTSCPMLQLHSSIYRKNHVVEDELAW